MASNNPDNGRSGQSTRGLNNVGRKPRSNRGRNNSSRNGLPAAPRNLPRNLHYSDNGQQRNENLSARNDSNFYARDVSQQYQASGIDETQHYRRPEASQSRRRGSQQNHQPRNVESNYHQQQFSVYENASQQPPDQYATLPPQVSQSWTSQQYAASNLANSSMEYYSTRGTATNSNTKQPRGSKTNDYRRNYGLNQSSSAAFGNGSFTGIEHQPFENIGREFYNSRNPGPSRPQQLTDDGNGGSQDVRYRRDEPKNISSSQDIRYRRDESGGSYGSQDRFQQRREESASGPPPQKAGKPIGRTYEAHNWRSDINKKSASTQPYQHKDNVREVMADTATQRERLTTQLTNGTYECMVCCESVKPVQQTWSCSQCFHVFHLGCVRRWSRTSQDESGQWRCPGCQSTNATLPNSYLCFCSKQKDPEWNRREIPHSCGEVCGKALGDGVSCIHSCTLLCHPGPCPTCSAQTQRKCPCSKTSQLVKCGSTDALLCGDTCDKQLSCGLHYCKDSCHAGPCQICPLTVEQSCFCGQSTRVMTCSIDHPKEENFQCELTCHKELDCGLHKCEQGCHPGDCGSCRLQVEVVTTCPCKKFTLKKLYQTKSIPVRKNCTDPVPVCGSICGRILTCGPSDNPHSCASLCHAGPCPPCLSSTLLRCRCGKNEKDISCRALIDLGEVLCERRCNKKRQCGRHKCIQVCCVEAEHICPMVCQRPLSCGRHRCEALCHAGNCNRCYNVSFDELSCHCGTQVIYPPVPCGARPPDCTKPCTRVRLCGHPQLHNCHPESSGCPPCVALCEKFCYGKHELRKNVPCHLTEVSCGKPCGKPLKCGRHSCQTNCHVGPCPTTCTQPCPVQRSECSHPCGLPCHEDVCPGTPCREKVKVQCQCGQRTATVSCEENEISYRKMATGLLASKMAQLQSGECVDFKDLLGNSAANKTKSLDCNEECALVERNRRLALALQIKNPNPKPGAPPYPDLLKNWAKKDPRFTQMVHDKLTELVQLAKQSVGKMKSRSYSFESMNRDKRQFVHEYCAFFGCESMSYDEEPKRNVVATAYGELSFLPAVGIMDVTRRELGQRKMPGPPRATGLTVLTSGSAQQAQQQPPSQPVQPPQQPPNAWGKSGAAPFRTLSEVVKSTPAPPAPVKSSEPKPAMVDYFDFTN